MSEEEKKEDWVPQTAEEVFVKSLMADAPPETFTPSPYLAEYRGGPLYSEPAYRGGSAFSAISGPRFDNYDQIMEVPLQPYKGPIRGRLDRQAKEVRARLDEPKAVMIVVRGRVYSAKSLWRVLLLYFKTKIFGLPKPPKNKKPKSLPAPR